jgi:hypothetical protein
MDIETLIRNATEEELPAIASALKRANERPAILVTLRTGGRRYVVCQEDEHLFADLVGLDEAKLAERVRHSLLVPFGAQWMRGAGDAKLTDSQLRNLEDALANCANDWIEENALDRAGGVAARCMGEETPRAFPADLCAVAFRPDAYDTAAAALQRFTAGRRKQGYTIHVVPVEGEPFDAELVDLVIDEDDGKWKAQVAPWDEEEDRGDRSKMRTFDIYDELDRLEVI